MSDRDFTPDHENATPENETLPLDHETVALDHETVALDPEPAPVRAEDPYLDPSQPLSPPMATAPDAHGHASPWRHDAPATEPRTRWAGIIWGVVIAAIAVVGIRTVIDDAARAATGDWWFGLTSVAGVAWFALAVGAIAVLCAAVGLIGRAQRRRAAASPSA